MARKYPRRGSGGSIEIYGNRKNIRKSIYKSKTDFVSTQYDGVTKGEVKYEDVHDYLLNVDVVSISMAKIHEG